LSPKKNLKLLKNVASPLAGEPPQKEKLRFPTGQAKSGWLFFAAFGGEMCSNYFQYNAH
jgi:hypothetical protein